MTIRRVLYGTVAAVLVLAFSMLGTFGLPRASAATPTGPGYWLAARDGGVFSYNVPFLGSATGQNLGGPIVGIAYDQATATGHETYYLASSTGQVVACVNGDCTSTNSLPAGEDSSIVGITATTNGYWLTDAAGHVYSFGDAAFHGSLTVALAAPIVGIAATKDGGGYWLVGADGGVFSFGDATYAGSAASAHITHPAVGIAANPAGPGYWITASDGGVFSYGGAPFEGSAGNLHLNAPIVGIAPDKTGNGYWLGAADGGVFSYGTAPFEGSAGNIHLAQPIVGITPPAA